MIVMLTPGQSGTLPMPWLGVKVSDDFTVLVLYNISQPTDA